MRRRLLTLAALAAATAATPVRAQVRTVPAVPASEKEALRGVDVFLLNEGDAPVEAEGPRTIQVTATDGTLLVIERLPAPRRMVPPGGFVKARYAPVGIAGQAEPPQAAHPPAELPARETVVTSSQGSSSGFLDRFTPHEPIYGVAGLKDSGAKLQFSLAFQPIGGTGLLSHLRFAYTQTMFWAVQQPSGPFTSTNYSPEIYAEVPVSDTVTIAAGYRHDSNGRGIDDSVDVNRIYGRIEKHFDLGNGWRFDVVPQAWFYVGRTDIGPRAADYFGYTSLTTSIGQEDGLKVQLTGRGNFRKKKGSAEMFVSYPLARIRGGIGFYVFGQGYTGYGEALDNLDVNDTHFRLGIALTR